MKKTFLTFIAVAGLGVTVSFAQTTTPTEDNQQNSEYQTEQQSNTMYQDDQQNEEGRTEVAMSELPSPVQEAFQSSEYSNYEVIAVYKKDKSDKKDQAASEDRFSDNEGAMAANEDERTYYEFELAQSGNMANQEGAVENSDIEGLETERVSDRRAEADVYLYIDESGEIVKEKDPEEKKDKKDKNHSGSDY